MKIDIIELANNAGYHAVVVDDADNAKIFYFKEEEDADAAKALVEKVLSTDVDVEISIGESHKGNAVMVEGDGAKVRYFSDKRAAQSAVDFLNAVLEVTAINDNAAQG